MKKSAQLDIRLNKLALYLTLSQTGKEKFEMDDWYQLYKINTLGKQLRRINNKPPAKAKALKAAAVKTLV